jgi:hypothetical protein
MDATETLRRLVESATWCLELLESLGERDRGSVIAMRADIEVARVALKTLPKGKS